MPPEFSDLITTWPKPVQRRFDQIRTCILTTAKTADTGPIEESLKWGQPAWRPKRPRTGSTLRLWWAPTSPTWITLYVNCQTTLCTDIDRACPDQFILQGNRGLSHAIATPFPQIAVQTCAEMTLTYFKPAHRIP